MLCTLQTENDVEKWLAAWRVVAAKRGEPLTREWTLGGKGQVFVHLAPAS